MFSYRELSLDDYLAILRRRLKVILIPTLVAPLIGYGISYSFSPKYTSSSLVLVEAQKVAQGYVQPVATEDFSEHMARLQEKVLSRNRLEPVIDRLQLVKNPSGNIEGALDDIRSNLTIQAVEPDLKGVTSSGKTATYIPQRSKSDPGVAGFNVSYTADTPHLAQTMCTELTSLLLEENLKDSEQVVQNTSDFLTRQIDEAKNNLDDQGKKLSAFKAKYLGQLPGDEETNLKAVRDLSAQLDTNNESLSRAQQDRAYTESVLDKELAAWKASDGSADPQTLQQQIHQLESQLVTLKARYTDDYPDVVKTRNDIAELKQKLNEMQSTNKKTTVVVADSEVSAAEPSQIVQLRSQIHQYDNVIAEASREQKHLQDEINAYQGRMAISPDLEQQYNSLTADYESSEKFYDDLLVKKSQSEMQGDMQRREEGEQMRLLNPAKAPDAPSFPVRWEFSAGGAGAGLLIGCVIGLWFELRDKAIRTEEDVQAALDLPMLVCVPWVGPDADEALTPYGYPRKEPASEETIQV